MAGFEAGIVYAAGWLCKAHGEETLAEYMLDEAGLDTIAKCRASGADQYDIDCARPAINSLALRKRDARREALKAEDGR